MFFIMFVAILPPFRNWDGGILFVSDVNFIHAAYLTLLNITIDDNLLLNLFFIHIDIILLFVLCFNNGFDYENSSSSEINTQ